MKNRKREICTSGSVRDEAGQPPHLLGRRDNFCIWPRALPRCRPCRASRGRKPIRRGRCASIVGFPPGGCARHLARLIGQWLSERLGQPFVIENRPGAGSNIATEAVVRCAAGRLHAPRWSNRPTRSTRRSTTSSISISSATSRRSRASSASPSSWW